MPIPNAVFPFNNKFAFFSSVSFIISVLGFRQASAQSRSRCVPFRTLEPRLPCLRSPVSSAVVGRGVQLHIRHFQDYTSESRYVGHNRCRLRCPDHLDADYMFRCGRCAENHDIRHAWSPQSLRLVVAASAEEKRELYCLERSRSWCAGCTVKVVASLRGGRRLQRRSFLVDRLVFLKHGGGECRRVQVRRQERVPQCHQ